MNGNELRDIAHDDYRQALIDMKHERDELRAKLERVKTALEWYAENVGDCNRGGEVGEIARNRLAKDVGNLADHAIKECG